MSQAERSPAPRATYRLQFHQGFRFEDAAALAPYLAQLGISHVYASCYLKARPGSTHGYDIVDHSQLNPELGADAEFRTMVAAFREHGLSQVLDFVPNHMGIGGSDNLWWLDVLEWGPDSNYAGWFDIDWEPDRRDLQNKVLVPLLGNQYGAVLVDGQLELRFDEQQGSFAIWAYDSHKLPICPLHYERVLGNEHPELERLGDSFSGLPGWRPRIPARACDLQAELAALVRERDEVRAAVVAAVNRLNGTPGDLESWRGLHVLIQDQHRRAAHFRVAADDINCRRFFNINELAGIRIELPELFEHAHRLIFSLIEDGTLEGVRIDHVDGLRNPKQYLQRLREHAPKPFYLVVGKILSRHEFLHEDWPVAGTTGYEFANLVLGLLTDPAGEEAFTGVYQRFTGENQPFGEIVRACKIRIMLNEMASELNVLARDADRVARQNPLTADLTHNILLRALTQIVACFPVYRTYIDGTASPADSDKRDLDWAVAQARRNDAVIDHSVFDFLHRLLSTELIAEPRSGFSRHSVVRVAMRFQQYSGPVMAKGLEDTAFYRYNRFVALNEVGGHPDHFGVSLAAFHRANTQRAQRWPDSMLGTSTHDTKRGEDTRARLAVLSEMPEEWERHLQTWSRILRARRGDVEGTAAPDRNDEYLFYQLLLGAWPAELTGVGLPDADALAVFSERMEGAMIKSIREAKLRTSWAAPNAAYEEATLALVRDALDPSRATFLNAFLPFQERVAKWGFVNTLVQTVLKLTLPGVPDIYQGCELWDLSLMDPDNRRPVDYDYRRVALRELLPALLRDRQKNLAALWENWRDGRLKLALTSLLLEQRKAQPELFALGSYEALPAKGSRAEHVCAFSRVCGKEALLIVAARFPVRLELQPAWGDTVISLPDERVGGSPYRDLLTGQTLDRVGDGLEMGVVLADLPIAVLVAEATSNAY